MRYIFALALAGLSMAAEPALFSPVINSLPGASGASFTADGRTVYFTARFTDHDAIVTSQLVDGRWTAPKRLEFSGRHHEGYVQVAPDGSRLWFWSYRPDGDQGAPSRRESHIWTVARTASGWGAPQRLPAPVNTGQREYSGTVDGEGNLYFSSLRKGGKGGSDLYFARRTGDGYAEPENLTALNSPEQDYAVTVSPDGQTMVFGSNRPGGSGDWDLYVSRRRDGQWQPPRNLGPRINSAFFDNQPRFTPDGKRLFFDSRRTGRSQIYWIDASALAEAAAGEPHP
jgi:Tol biopolymer transport system component